MKGSVYKRCPCGVTGGGGGRRPACKKDHGTWYYVADLEPDRDGKRRQERRGGYSSRDDAQEALNNVLKGVADGTYAHDERKTVGSFLEEWLAAKVAGGLRVTTARAYQQHIRDHLAPALGHLRLRELRTGHVQALLRNLGAGNERGPATVRRIHATLRSALATAVRQQLVASNVARNVELPAAARPKVRPWEPADLGRFLDSVAADRLAALFETIASTGLRRGEACGLRWDDVDLGAGHIVVRQQIVEVSGAHPCRYCATGHRGLTFGPPKTASGDARTVELDSGTLGVLLGHRLAQDAERAEWGEAYADHGLVFAREDGNPLPPTNAVTKRFAELAKAAGLRHVRLHDLRHGAASLRLAAGADISIVSKVLGHSSISITSDTYSHLLAGVGKAAAEAAAALVPRSRRDQSVTTDPESTASGPVADGASAQVSDGGPPGTRTLNLRIKSGKSSVPSDDER